MLCPTPSGFRGYFKWIGSAAFVSALWLVGCLFSQNTKIEDTVSFENLYDSLAQFDSVVIVMKDPNGNFLDTVFHGKVTTKPQIENLNVKGWEGGKVDIQITGYQGTQIAYQSEKKFDGSTNKNDTTLILISPATSLTCNVQDVQMLEGDTLLFPAVTVSPATLADKSVTWISSDPSVVRIAKTSLQAVKRGSATLTVQLNSDKTRTLTIQATVGANTRIPDSLYISPDTVYVSVGGASGKFAVKVIPSSADNAVAWRLSDSTLASIASDGTVAGLQKGATRVWATSKEKSAVSDSAWIVVSAPVPVDKIHFLKNPVTLYIGGSAESLMVAVSPASANPAVLFTVSDSSKVALKDAKITGLAAGATQVIARSKAYADKTDTLNVTVIAGSPVSGIALSPKPAGPVYTGGARLQLTATVAPADAPQGVQWKSGNAAFATVDDSGRVTGVLPGSARIYAISKVDSSKKDSVDVAVKRDMPQVSMGQDTTVSVGQTVAFLPVVRKENGAVILFKWDLNGDGAWDDSSITVKTVSYKFDQQKEYVTRFYVGDNQGNDTIVTKKVKAVSGPVILITSPANNSATNHSPLKVVWSVNGIPQDTLPLEPLKDGANTLTRTAKDSAGTSFSASVTVYYDTLPPNKPLVHGATNTNSTLPTWTWGTGGSGGAGVYRIGLDAESFTAPETKDTSYTPATELKEGVHTLFVQERDAAGNWSASGRLTTRIDLTPPGNPNVTVAPAVLTNNPKPAWSWTSGGGGAAIYRYRLDSADLKGAAESANLSFAPGSNLSEGSHTLYVQERDSAGNWSASGSAVVRIDVTPPSVPVFDTLPKSPLNSLQPTWKWTSGGGGNDTFRCRLDNSDLTTGASTVTSPSFATPSAQTEGPHTLYIQERDSAGNWSATASRVLVLAVRGAIGGAGISPAGADGVSLTIDTAGLVYVGFSDGSNGGKVAVLKYGGISWKSIRTGQYYEHASDRISLAADNAGTPYLAFVDDSSLALNIQKFTGLDWSPLTVPSITAYWAFCIEGDGVPYVVGTNGQRSSQVTLVRFTGTKWDTVGTSFPGLNPTCAQGGTGVPIIGFSNTGEGAPSAEKFNGEAWEAIGSSGFISDLAQDISAVVDPSGNPFMAFSYTSGGGGHRLMSYDGVVWKDVGAIGTFDPAISTIALAMDKNGILYAAFGDSGNGGKLVIKRFNGMNWESVGGPGLSVGQATSISLKVSRSGIPIVAFSDAGNGNKLTVMKVSFDP